MDKLVTYVSAIHGHPGPVTVQKRTVVRDSWWDQGFEVQKEEAVYSFDNGAVIRRLVEQDQFPAELVCAECWISYEVIEQPRSHEVRPTKKSFDNTCRELFWLKYHTA